MKVISNGSKWLGEKPDTTEKLLEVLKTNDLDVERFGAFGFCKFLNNEPSTNHNIGNEQVRILGNFVDISHVFELEGTYDELNDIIVAIENNISRIIKRMAL